VGCRHRARRLGSWWGVCCPQGCNPLQQAGRSMQAGAALALGVSQQAFKHATGIWVAGVIAAHVTQSIAQVSATISIRVTGWRGGQSASSERARSAHVLGFVIVSPRLIRSCRFRGTDVVGPGWLQLGLSNCLCHWNRRVGSPSHHQGDRFRPDCILSHAVWSLQTTAGQWSLVARLDAATKLEQLCFKALEFLS
jgi:hypothetical protein